MLFMVLALCCLCFVIIVVPGGQVSFTLCDIQRSLSLSLLKMAANIEFWINGFLPISKNNFLCTISFNSHNSPVGWLVLNDHPNAFRHYLCIPVTCVSIRKWETLNQETNYVLQPLNALFPSLNCIKLKSEVLEPNTTGVHRKKTMKLGLVMLTLYLSDSDQL